MGKGILDTLKANAQEAAYRVISTQIMKAAKDGVLNVLRKRGIHNKYVESVSNFIDTDIGTALLSTGVGFSFSYIAPFKHDKRAKVLAREFRVGGMALAANLLVDKATVDVLPYLDKILDMLPATKVNDMLTKLRIIESSPEPMYEELDEYKPSKVSSALETWK
jgi:hypothetical protein